MPKEMFSQEEFLDLSKQAKYCVVKRLKKTVKLKLRTPRSLYTLKIVPDKSDEIIKKLHCEIREE